MSGSYQIRGRVADVWSRKWRVPRPHLSHATTRDLTYTPLILGILTLTSEERGYQTPATNLENTT